jgi:hypothetical protein
MKIVHTESKGLALFAGAKNQRMMAITSCENSIKVVVDNTGDTASITLTAEQGMALLDWLLLNMEMTAIKLNEGEEMIIRKSPVREAKSRVQEIDWGADEEISSSGLPAHVWFKDVRDCKPGERFWIDIDQYRNDPSKWNMRLKEEIDGFNEGQMFCFNCVSSEGELWNYRSLHTRQEGYAVVVENFALKP